MLTMIPPHRYMFAAGQYVEFHFKDDAGEFKRFYSIANAPNDENAIQFCIVMAEDRVTNILKKLKIGDRFHVSDARGKFALQTPHKPIVLVAGGSGISPIRAFFQQLTVNFSAPPQHILHLVYGCKHSQHIPGKEEFLDYSKQHSRNPKLWLIAETVASEDTEVQHGNILQHLPAAIVPGADYYLCGPKGMIEAVKELLAAHKIPPNHIFQEKY